MSEYIKGVSFLSLYQRRFSFQTFACSSYFVIASKRNVCTCGLSTRTTNVIFFFKFENGYVIGKTNFNFYPPKLNFKGRHKIIGKLIGQLLGQAYIKARNGMGRNIKEKKIGGQLLSNNLKAKKYFKYLNKSISR